jgi:4-amino-4-deoxy-L-arabinose transferase-like glycosyltransferase
MKQLISNIKKYSAQNPLAFILILAIIVRLVAVFFAKGFGMHDDHFLYIEIPQSWVDGHDYNNWLPWSAPGNMPQGHSFLYPGINFLILWCFKFIGIDSIEAKMLLMRAIHAAFSLLVVSFGYKITLKLSNAKTAFSVGLLLAILWLFPWLSVRTMVEIVTIPFLMLSIWSLVKVDFEDSKIGAIPFLLSGIWCGIAFSIRFQVAFFILGLGIVILFKKGLLKAVWFTLGFLIVLLLTQGLIDFLIWKRPFAELMEYFRYNVVHKGDYPNGPWYNYFLVLMGVVIPPLSLFMLAGVMKSWKRLLLIFLPMFLFFAFHSYFPNKQERFILPILPFFIILGMIGWNELRDSNRLKWFTKKAERIVWITVLVINMVLLIAISTMYSKRSRVESMLYLSEYQDIHSFLIENSVDNMTLWSPMFYTGQYPKEFNVTKSWYIDTLSLPWISADEPRFVLFYTQERLDERIMAMKKLMPGLQYETTIYPGLIDRLLSNLNPVNKNYVVTIYRNNKFQLQKK